MPQHAGVPSSAIPRVPGSASLRLEGWQVAPPIASARSKFNREVSDCASLLRGHAPLPARASHRVRNTFAPPSRRRVCSAAPALRPAQALADVRSKGYHPIRLPCRATRWREASGVRWRARGDVYGCWRRSVVMILRPRTACRGDRSRSAQRNGGFGSIVGRRPPWLRRLGTKYLYAVRTGLSATSSGGLLANARSLARRHPCVRSQTSKKGCRSARDGRHPSPSSHPAAGVGVYESGGRPPAEVRI